MIKSKSNLGATCPKCNNKLTFDIYSDTEAYLDNNDVECPICEYKFNLRFVNFLPGQTNGD